ncbi:MAG: tetratricopeptide repeat protein [bacterium]
MIRRSFRYCWLLPTVFLLPFCTQTHSPEIQQDPSRQAAVRDSIGVLDSLVSIYKIRDPKLAQTCARSAMTLARQIDDRAMEVRAYRLMGFSLINTDEDSSFIFYHRGLEIADSFRITGEKPHLYYNLAVIYQQAQNYQTALAYYDSARRMFSHGDDFANLSNAWCAIGNIKHDLYDYTGAREAYDTALKIAVDHFIHKQRGIALANLSKYADTGQRAIRMQKEAIEYLNKSEGNEEEIALILINIGKYFPDPDSALVYYKEAIRLGEKYSLEEVMIGAYNNMVYSFLDKGDLAQAEACLKKYAIPLAQSDSNFDWLSTLYDSYADVFAAKGDFRNAFASERKAMEAKGRSDTKRATGQVRLLAALLDLKNKELLIRVKSQQVLAEESRSRQFLLWLIIAMFVAIGLGVLVFILSQRNRLNMQRQQIDSATRILRMEEQEKERLGRELHDLTGQVILGIAGELEQAGFTDMGKKEHLQQRIREIGDGIRQISHRMAKPGMHQLTLAELVTDLCDSYRKSLGMEIALKMPTKLPDLPPEATLHLYRVVQELLTNASKYARESLVSLAIHYDGKQIELFYSDEGPGFDKTNLPSEGMGLSIIFERIKFLGGEARLETDRGAGTFWEIIVPVHRSTK